MHQPCAMLVFATALPIASKLPDALVVCISEACARASPDMDASRAAIRVAILRRLTRHVEPAEVELVDDIHVSGVLLLQLLSLPVLLPLRR
jgi:hypothetical protein